MLPLLLLGSSAAQLGLQFPKFGRACLGHNQQTGCLRNGCLADMVVLDQDPFVVDQADIATISIDQVWLGGSQVH